MQWKKGEGADQEGAEEGGQGMFVGNGQVGGWGRGMVWDE